MEVIYSEKAQRDREYWKKSGNKAIMNKITALINDIQLHPFEGIGKPEPLKYELSGFWSRQINQKDRLIYTVNEDIVTVFVISAMGHYSDK